MGGRHGLPRQASAEDHRGRSAAPAAAGSSGTGSAPLVSARNNRGVGRAGLVWIRQPGHGHAVLHPTRAGFTRVMASRRIRSEWPGGAAGPAAGSRYASPTPGWTSEGTPSRGLPVRAPQESRLIVACIENVLAMLKMGVMLIHRTTMGGPGGTQLPEGENSSRNGGAEEVTEPEERSRAMSEDDLLASEIHEARRPVTLARGYVEMLSAGTLGALTEPQRRTMARIEDTLAEATRQINRLGTIARLRPGQHKDEQLAVDHEVQRAVRRAAAKAELRGGTVEVRLEPVLARGDPRLLARILDNLIDNALTYVDGSPHVLVETGLAERPFVMVSDRGFGFSPEGTTLVFTPAFRDRPEDRKRPGTGLGLFLSRRAAEEMGGSLTLERSAPGAGATFRLELLPDR